VKFSARQVLGQHSTSANFTKPIDINIVRQYYNISLTQAQLSVLKSPLEAISLSITFSKRTHGAHMFPKLLEWHSPKSIDNQAVKQVIYQGLFVVDGAELASLHR